MTKGLSLVKNLTSYENEKLLLPITLTFAMLIGAQAIAPDLPTCPRNQSQQWHNCRGSYTFAKSGDNYVGEFKNSNSKDRTLSTK